MQFTHDTCIGTAPTLRIVLYSLWCSRYGAVDAEIPR